jgi:hypothetical protein
MVDTKGNASAPLIASLLDAFMAAGRTRAVLPPNRRDEIIAVLARLMADPDALDAYTATLEDERRRRGRDVELRLLGMAGLDIPGDQIATEGFGGLSDDHLADIALSPEAIHAIREHLDEAECGAWLIDKIIEVESARPEAAECARRAKEIFQGLRNIRLLGTDKPDTIAMGEEKEQRRPSLRSLLRPGPGLLALAASLLVGVLLGGLALRGLRPSTGETEVLLASVTPKFGTLRGSEHSLLVEVASVRPGFATIITLAPDRPQQVFPEPGEDPIRVHPSARETYGPLPPDSITALALITEVPATELIREALLSQEFKAGDLARLDGYLRKLLSQSGYRWVGMSYTPIVQRETK